MRTASHLPGILRWFEVVETESITLNPIEAAIDTMESRNKELRHLVTQYSAEGAPADLNPLTMRLNGNIDAAVCGGIAKYQEVRAAEGRARVLRQGRKLEKLLVVR